jgi:hypothetical protein
MTEWLDTQVEQEAAMKTTSGVRAGMQIVNDTDQDARVRVAGGGSG